jgi:hypothetical protein
MPNVLIRDVPTHDLDQIRAAAAAQGTSLQSYLLGVVHAQAMYIRRQAVIARTAERLRGRPDLPDDERDAVLAVIDQAHHERAAQLSARPPG